MENITKALNDWDSVTRGCIKFKKRKDEENYVRINSRPTGCHATLGMKGGEKNLNLGLPGCGK